MKFKYIKPKKLKFLMGLFFCAGILGIIVGLSNHILMMTAMGVINIGLGGLVGLIFIYQEPRSRDKRKKKRDDN
jgi:hypothetical protein